MHIKAVSISDAWGQCLYGFLSEEEVYKQVISRGSFENESYRLQFPALSMEILNAVVDVIPQVPTGAAPPCTQDYIDNYFTDYILYSGKKSPNEEYTYAERIGGQLQIVMDMLLKTPQTNQSIIEVGRPEDCELHDPACLREIHFRVVNGHLDMTVLWRSNDMFAAFVGNHGGLGKLQEMVAEYIGFPMGKLHYYSSGSHLYAYQIPSVEQKTGLKYKC